MIVMSHDLFNSEINGKATTMRDDYWYIWVGFIVELVVVSYLPIIVYLLNNMATSRLSLYSVSNDGH